MISPSKFTIGRPVPAAAANPPVGCVVPSMMKDSVGDGSGVSGWMTFTPGPGMLNTIRSGVVFPRSDTSSIACRSEPTAVGSGRDG